MGWRVLTPIPVVEPRFAVIMDMVVHATAGRGVGNPMDRSLGLSRHQIRLEIFVEILAAIAPVADEEKNRIEGLDVEPFILV